MRIPNLPSWSRRLRIQRTADVVERRQGILLIAHLPIDERLELSHHHVDLAVDHGNEAAVRIIRTFVVRHPARSQITLPVLPLFFVFPFLRFALGEVFIADPFSRLDERLQANDVVAADHGHLRFYSVVQPGNLSAAP